MFMTDESVLCSYVLERDGKIIAFASYYIVDTQLLEETLREKYTYIRNGYIYHYAIKESISVTPTDIMRLIIREMKNQGIDVCTCLNVCRN